MIDVARFRAELASKKGDQYVLPPKQMAELLDEVELGQHARRSLSNLRNLVNLHANTSGAPA